ncbi:MAG: MBL fold metallo-hydrolase [Gemmatimonadota bacterium]
MPTTIRFAGYPSAFVFKEPDGNKAVQHLLWGDWLRLNTGRQGDFVEVHARGVDGWMHKDDIRKDRLLEITFVDIGQGDGCLVVTPDDKHIVIDAGQNDNMDRYLRWRYGGFAAPWEFEAAIISHPDQDHYGGFQDLFYENNVTFGTVYHNGIVERTGKNSLGPRKKANGRSYLTGPVGSEDELKEFLSVESRWKRKKYPTMLAFGINNGSFSKFRSLSTADGFLPGYEDNRELSMQVLGPVVEPDDQSRARLRWLGSVGKTKNGHSVVLRLKYHDVSVFLGGDLNIPSQELLLRHHTGLNPRPKSIEQHHQLIGKARQSLQVDVAKACHHGSGDFLSSFLECLNPAATVISSGDDEPHSHPRADALGAIGLRSRGERPLIFSTELARSVKEAIKHPHVLRERLKELRKGIEKAPTRTAQDRRRKVSLEKEFNKIVDSIERSVAVYGAIHLRSDGQRVVIAQKLERRRGSTKWDIYRLEPDATGSLSYISKH